MESKITRLEAQVLNLEAKVNPLQREVDRLKNQNEQKKTPSLALEDAEIDVLKLLARYSDGITAPQIAHQMGWQQPRCEHFLNQLRQKEMITVILVMGGHARYVLDHSGNAYLVKNNLV